MGFLLIFIIEFETIRFLDIANDLEVFSVLDTTEYEIVIPNLAT